MSGSNKENELFSDDEMEIKEKGHDEISAQKKDDKEQGIVEHEKHDTQDDGIDDLSAIELQEIRAFLKDQKKKKEAVETKRRRSMTTSTSTLSGKSGVCQHPIPKKSKSTAPKKIMYEKNKPEKLSNFLYCDDEIPSDEPDNDDVIELGVDEDDYKRLRYETLCHEKESRECSKLVPQQLLNQAEALKKPRKGIFLHLCNPCKEHLKKKEEYLFKAGEGGTFVLTIELCGSDLDKNIVLADYYGSSMGAKTRSKQIGEGTSQSKTYFEKMAGVLYYKLGDSCQSVADKKLLAFKYALVLYQCAKCEELQKSQARDLFLQKKGLSYDRGYMYVLHFMCCSDCRVMNRDYQALIFKNFNTYSK